MIVNFIYSLRFILTKYRWAFNIWIQEKIDVDNLHQLILSKNYNYTIDLGDYEEIEESQFYEFDLVGRKYNNHKFQIKYKYHKFIDELYEENKKASINDILNTYSHDELKQIILMLNNSCIYDEYYYNEDNELYEKLKETEYIFPGTIYELKIILNKEGKN
jgi:hypothetical protein